ncbi:MAG: hypothetical protein V4858_10380 [Pseudomonadota bacterium]
MLKDRFETYSPEAYLRLKRHIFRACRFGSLWFGILSSLLVLAVVRMSQGEGYAGLGAVATALLIYSLFPTYGRLRELFVTPPNLLAYFSAKVPGFTSTGGVELLQHSRALDALAMESGLKRIGEFVSDDDFFDKSDPKWHSARDGLATIDALLQQHSSHPSVLAAKQDLTCIRERLKFAESNGIQFCLLLRDFRSTNGMEWEQRKGYC